MICQLETGKISLRADTLFPRNLVLCGAREGKVRLRRDKFTWRAPLLGRDYLGDFLVLSYCAKRKETGALVAPAGVAQREPNLGSRKSCGATFCDVMIDIESAWGATNDG